MFEGQPKGLWTLALANTGERFGYYTMLAVFTLFLQANFGFDEKLTSTIFSSFLMLVYFLPLFGGMLADKFGYSKMVTIGIFIMFIGYVLLSLPLGKDSLAIIAMAGALLLVSLGTGLFKGNLQVMVGDLYNDPQFASKRDSGFQLFYMAINVGALFAPTAAVKMMAWAQNSLSMSEADSYHFAFAVACASLIVSIAIYYLGKRTFAQVITTSKKDVKTAQEEVEQLSKSETTERIICLCLVFAVVLFFWMAFHQNGLTLTFFARDYTATSATGVTAMEFDVMNLVWCILIIYGLFSLFQSKTAKGKGIGAALVFIPAAILGYTYYQNSDAVVAVDAPIFQQFNPAFVVALTPVSIALFGWLAKIGKEPKAPVKIGLGMLVAAAAYIMMTLACIGLPLPAYDAEGTNLHMADVTPNLLVSTYLVLTFAELLLSPIGISFVTKVAPPKYKGMMMGGWFVSTALGNFLVQIPGYLWGKDLTIVWGVLAGICLLAALFIFSIIKKLNKVA
ncbi:MAG: peptide MFS transporter [Bacteroidaceae bacterium]|nr:peptide MFS transporter [Bacteroidaceae bacterium]MBQ9667118.1 peptide MFS transporter [Bacteroidaceae bacterium]